MSPRHQVVLFVACHLALAGCDDTPDPTPTPEQDSGGFQPSPWSYEEEVGEDSILPSATIEAELATMVPHFLTFDPLTFMEQYDIQLQYRGDRCPTINSQRASQVYWEGDCLTEDGAHFDGWAASSWAKGMPNDDGELCDHLAYYLGFVNVADPTGMNMEAFGTIDYSDCLDDKGLRTLAGHVGGDYEFDLAADTWMEDRQPVQVSFRADVLGDTRHLWVDGVLKELDGELATAWLEDAHFDSDGACTTEPDATLHAWDTDGTRYDIVFDGSSACDGCAAVIADGQSVGEVCVDWSLYYTWTDRPWIAG